MELRIRLKTEARAEEEIRTVPQGTTIETLATEYDLPYRILAAKLDNKICELTKKIEAPCAIEFLDMRSQAANLIYQRSLSLLYLKAIYDVLGTTLVKIENSLNKGLYTEIRGVQSLSLQQVADVEARMRELVQQDLPFVKEVLRREEAMAVLTKDHHREKTRMIERAKEVETLPFYSLAGFRNFFYGQMTPSTGYVPYFELMKYRRGVLLRFPHPSDPNVIPPYVDEVKMYQAFGEATQWGKLMDISFVGDLNEQVESGGYREMIQISEALHEKKIAQIADLINDHKKRIILIAGPSSSGKTTFARRLCIQLRVNGLEPLYLGTDDYFVERTETPLDEHGEPNFEDITSIDIQLFNDHMNALLRGEAVDIPIFDFLEGKKNFGQRMMGAKKGQPIVIEGIHGLNQALTAGIAEEEKFKIYISPLTLLNIDEHNRIPTTDARMLRRLVRDYQFRGHSAQSTIRSWPKVRKGEDQNIFPFSGEADVFFNSAHLYELGVLKKYAEPLLTQVKREEPEYAEAVRMLKYLAFFQTIEEDRIIANNSILREFIGGSIFV